MADSSYRETARRYCVEDLPGASLPGARLQGILESLHLGKPVTARGLGFLEKEGLDSLHRLATGQLSLDGFRNVAPAEQSIRIEKAAATRLAAEAESAARKADMQEQARLALERAENARLARESDHKYIARLKQRELRARYGIDDFVEDECFGRLMSILKRVDARQRLGEEDFLWLSTTGKDYFTEELRAAYHRLEADHFAGEFKKSRDPWAAVNASGHYRKSRLPDSAESLLEAIPIDRQQSKKLKSALCTTRGGVMRDLERWDEALQLGQQAHAFMPTDYRPCTLLGAVHVELGDYALGQEWFAKAIERGATVDAVDKDLRNIFFRANEAKREEMRAFLLREDPDRYSWVNTKGRKQRRPR